MTKNITILLLLFVALTARGQKNTSAISELFCKAPISVFDHTTEGISLEEKNDLIVNGESQSWKITSESDKILEIKCKHPSSKMIFFLLEKQNSSPFMMSYTQNEDNSTIETWGLNNEEIEKEKLLPAIAAKDFFSKSTQVNNISGYNNNIQYRFDIHSRLIHVELYAWMEDSLENLKTDYEILLKWTDNGFEVQKAKRDNK